MIREGPSGCLTTTVPTYTDASVGKSLSVTVMLFPTGHMPDCGSTLKGASASRSKGESTSPTLVRTKVFVLSSRTVAKPKSRYSCTFSPCSFSVATTRMKKLPLLVMNSITSSYTSFLIGRKDTSTLEAMPGDRVTRSGNFMKKKLVSGSLNLNLMTEFDTFLSTSFCL